MSQTFTNRKALVTGAGRGIGRAIALELSNLGVEVACLSKSQSSCGAVADEIVKNGGKAKAFPCDVSDPAQIKAACEKIAAEFGHIDILVNNAGITADGLIMRMSDDAWNSVISTNLTSVFHFTKIIGSAMVKNRWGRIINISSVVGLTGNAGQANYSAAKAGVLGLTRSNAKEFASRGITVNAVCPGFIQTDMTDKLTADQKTGVMNFIPLKRLGQPEEIAHAVTFLASEEAAYITGQSIPVDGGMVTV